MNTLSNEDGKKLEEATSKDSPTEEKAGRTGSCEYCDKEFSSRKNLRQHIRRVHFKILECPVCDKYFDKEYLKFHREAVHLKKRKECQDCGMSFKINNLPLHR